MPLMVKKRIRRWCRCIVWFVFEVRNLVSGYDAVVEDCTVFCSAVGTNTRQPRP